MRAFFAFPLNTQIKNTISDFCNKYIYPAFTNIKKVDIDNLHITIKFLGEIDENLITPLKEKLSQIQYNNSKCEAEITGLDTFPAYTKANILWIGVRPDNDKMTFIYENINKTLHELKIPPVDNKKFHPHITIARFKKSPDPQLLYNILEKYKNQFFGKQVLNSFILYKSILGPQKPVYLPIFEFSI